MKSSRIELIVGLFMLAGLIALVMLAVVVSGLGGSIFRPTYHVTAYFDNVGDLKVRAPVSIAGVRIGEVSHICLDPDKLTAKVVMTIDSRQNRIPYHVTAQIFTQGVLGSNYIGLVPGYAAEIDTGADKGDEPEYLHEGVEITDTQPAMVLENLVGQLIFNMKKDR